MGALNGLKVLDFTTLLPGPFATMMLADLGAEVVKVSGAGRYDMVVDWPPVIEGTDLSAGYGWLARNKKNISLDLKRPETVAAVKELVKEYDVVVEQFRPGVMDKLGVGYEALKEANPAVIYCALTGYGQYGPLAMRAGHDCNYMARAGILSAAGTKEHGPSLYNFQIADIASGANNVVVGILAAAFYRQQTGKGQFVDISMEDGVVPFNSLDGAGYLGGGELPGRESGQLNGGGVYNIYETSDGRYMSVGSLEPKFFAELSRGLGHPEWEDGAVLKTDIEGVKAQIRADFATRTRDEWTVVFAQYDACVEPVMTMEEATQDAHLIERGMWPDVPLPQAVLKGCADDAGDEISDRTVKQMGCPVNLSESPAEYRHTAYPEGHNTYAFFAQRGYSDEEIKVLSGK